MKTVVEKRGSKDRWLGEAEDWMARHGMEEESTPGAGPHKC